MTQHIQRITEGVSALSQLPRSLKPFEPFYAGARPLIPANAATQVLGLVSSDDSNTSSSKVYVLCSENDDARTLARKVLEACSGANRNGLDSLIGQRQLVFGILANDKVRQELCKSIEEKKNSARQTQNLEDEAKKKIEAADAILISAMQLKTSDIHFESDGQRAVVRFRVYKEMIDFMHLTHQEAVDICNLYYSTFVRSLDSDQDKGSGGGVYRFSNLLDGEFSRTLSTPNGNINIKARMSNIGQNNQGYFTMVLRLIDKSKALSARTFMSMGFSTYACKRLSILQRASRGMMLIGGVTGSGKSTTLQNCLLLERDRTGNSRKTYTIEQPIEQTMSRIIQVNAANSHEGVGTKKSSEEDFSFDNLNRMFMRGDPDTIAYGEIRDNSTAEAAIKGVESGHLVFGTMHISNPMGVFSRFGTFGIPMEKLCRNGFLKMVLFQHLIPKLCPHCSIPYKQGGVIPDEFGEFYSVKSFKSADGVSLDMARVIPLKQSLAPGESLIRRLQREKIINAAEAALMKSRIHMMNADNDTFEFQKRLDSFIESSNTQNDSLNVRFRGDGCKHCFNGTVGVIPAAEILTPDEHFLELVLDGKINRAESYWKAKLGGRNATADMYPNILSGMVDPRMVETELDILGK